ncbi:hypothetical protein B0J18DRAFT_44343 [Chaetomium sp. MPI-SDFR-AT-0129]|nr:hypothetical protein B0J18DRAFT_44343 [Chaetomium sp. MPI-SDFR-AT-0129]
MRHLSTLFASPRQLCTKMMRDHFFPSLVSSGRQRRFSTRTQPPTPKIGEFAVAPPQPRTESLSTSSLPEKIEFPHVVAQPECRAGGRAKPISDHVHTSGSNQLALPGFSQTPHHQPLTLAIAGWVTKGQRWVFFSDLCPGGWRLGGILDPMFSCLRSSGRLPSERAHRNERQSRSEAFLRTRDIPFDNIVVSTFRLAIWAGLLKFSSEKKE